MNLNTDNLELVMDGPQFLVTKREICPDCKGKGKIKHPDWERLDQVMADPAFQDVSDKGHRIAVLMKEMWPDGNQPPTIIPCDTCQTEGIKESLVPLAKALAQLGWQAPLEIKGRPELCMDFPMDHAEHDLAELDINPMIKGLLVQRGGISTVEQLLDKLSQSPQAITSIRGIGPAYLNQLLEQLWACGFPKWGPWPWQAGDGIDQTWWQPTPEQAAKRKEQAQKANDLPF